MHKVRSLTRIFVTLELDMGGRNEVQTPSA